MRHSLLPLLPWLLAALAFAGVALHPPNNLDVSWYLVAARTWAAGGELYVTLRDPNTPAVWYLFLGIERLAGWLGLPAHRLFYLLVALASLGLLWLTMRLLPAADAAGRRRRQATLLAGAFLCGFAGLTLAGQRDPLVVLLLLPYLAWIQRLSESAADGHRRLGSLATLLAGLGLLIKPHFLIWILLLEGLLAWRLGSWRSWRRGDLRWPARATLLLGLALLLGHPAYLDYLERYASYYSAFPAAALSSRTLFGLLLLALLLAFRLLLGRPDRGWGDTLLVGAVAALLTALLQGKWWDYQAMPIETLAGLAWVALLLRGAPADRWGPAWRRLALRALTWAALAWFAGAAVSASKQQLRFVLRPFEQPAAAALAAAFDDLAKRQPVAVLGGTTGVIAAYLSQARWALPDPSYWVVDLLAPLHRSGDAIAPALLRAEARHFEDVAAALARTRPTLLAFAEEGDSTSVDALAYYRRDAAMAQLLGDYRLVGHAGGYALWLRDGH